MSTGCHRGFTRKLMLVTVACALLSVLAGCALMPENPASADDPGLLAELEGTIVFESTRAEGEAPLQLYRIDLPSLEMSRVSPDDSQREQQPRVFGTQVSFLVIVKGQAHSEARLYNADLSGWRGAEVGGGMSIPRFAVLADGRQVIEVDDLRDGSQISLRILENGQTRTIALLKDGEFLESAGGEKVLIGNWDGVGTGELSLINVDTGERTQILGGPIQAQEAQLSPDGTRLVFVSAVEGNNLFVVNIDGSALTQITHDSYDNISPSWSPDGKYIVYASSRNGRNQFRNHTLHVVTADGSRQVTLTEWVGEGMDDDDPSWTYSR